MLQQQNIYSFREKLDHIVSSQFTEKFIISLLIVNAITLGLETSTVVMNAIGPVIHVIDIAILSVFVVEIMARLIAKGPSFFRNGWNIFDALIVIIALVPSTGPLQVLRSLRILRILRLTSAVPSMRRVVNGLITAIPGMGSITALLILIFYICAVVATNLYGPSHPKLFGTIGASFYSLFQVMTLEGWSDGIVRPVMEVHPYAWIFFIPFILLTSFTVLNLFIGIIVSSIQQDYEEVANEERDALKTNSKLALKEVRELKGEIALLREQLEKSLPDMKK
ncbi:MAG: ion transporter [Methyloligellaceae bacterium]